MKKIFKKRTSQLQQIGFLELKKLQYYSNSTSTSNSGLQRFVRGRCRWNRKKKLPGIHYAVLIYIFVECDFLCKWLVVKTNISIIGIDLLQTSAVKKCLDLVDALLIVKNEVAEYIDPICTDTKRKMISLDWKNLLWYSYSADLSNQGQLPNQIFTSSWSKTNLYQININSRH